MNFEMNFQTKAMNSIGKILNSAPIARLTAHVAEATSDSSPGRPSSQQQHKKKNPKKNNGTLYILSFSVESDDMCLSFRFRCRRIEKKNKKKMITKK